MRWFQGDRGSVQECLRYPRLFVACFRLQQFFNKLELPLVNVAVLGVKNQFARLQLEVPKPVDVFHESLVKKLQSRDIGW